MLNNPRSISANGGGLLLSLEPSKEAIEEVGARNHPLILKESQRITDSRNSIKQ